MGPVGLLHASLFEQLCLDRMCAIRVAVHCSEGFTLLMATLTIACRELLRVRHERRSSWFRVTICTFPPRDRM